jgi:DNA polymerase-3 subunit epsilon
MIRFFKKPDSDICRRYLAETGRRRPQRQPVGKTRFVVLDTETTGFDLCNDRILSIALFEVNGGIIDMAKSRKWLVCQPETAPTSATAIHGILPSESRCKGIAEKEVLEQLLPLLSGAILVGHHIHFDAGMLNKALKRHLKIKLRNHLVDTAHLAMQELIPFHRTGYANQRPPSLDEICAHLDLPVIARHTAEGDAFVTAEIFMMLCGRIRRRLQNRKVRRREPQLRDLPVFPFRK